MTFKALMNRKKCSSNQNFTTLKKATDNLFSSEKVCKTFYQILEIEKQIAFDNNNLASFRTKWATFKQCPSEYNLTNTVN